MPSRRTYSYRSSVKSDLSDELINTHLLRPAAGLIVRLLYPTRVTPNHVTIASTIAGILAGVSYLQGIPSWTFVAGVLITLKDLLDSADGQLARAKEMYSRTGRFLDSLGDILVNALVFTAITVVLFRVHGDPLWIALGTIGFLGITLRVSYHVFYQASFLHCQRMYAVNRTTEEIREEDRAGSRTALTLQRIFLFLYGWQDRCMLGLDRWCRSGIVQTEANDQRWYGDPTGLRLSGFLGMGTELFLLMAFSVANRLEWYFFVNVAGSNGLWAVCIMYRRFVLREAMRRVA
jgi:phosphatidylglycerophosphate synthase